MSRAVDPADGSILAALLFALIFIFGWRLHRARTPRAVLSLGAGATASYVFVRMLPELDEAKTAFVAASAGRALPAPELRVYTAALVGFIVFYGLENLVAWSRERPEPEAAIAMVGPGVPAARRGVRRLRVARHIPDGAWHQRHTPADRAVCDRHGSALHRR